MDNEVGMISVYRVVPVNGYGLQLHEKPRIPDNAALSEDQHTPRIPVCLTIPGAIEAAELVYSIDLFDKAYMAHMHNWVELHPHENRFPFKESRDYGFDFDVICALVPGSKLYQPTSYEVPDAWKTGEMWLLEPTDFVHYGRYHIRRHMEIGGAYARYAVTEKEPDPAKHGIFKEDYDEVVDRQIGTAIYGEENAFSFITMDPQLAADVEEDMTKGKGDT